MNKKGFTLIELMVAVVILGLVMAAVVTVLINTEKAKREAELLMECQQNARAALDIMSRDVRSAGFGIFLGSPQPVIVYATPFECIFNGNIEPYPDNDLAHLEPRAYDPNVNPACPNYNPGIYYTTGAETYRYFIDSTNSLAKKTTNPNDAILIRQTYGQSDNNTNQFYDSLNQEIALVKGPANATDASLVPMFQYWYRDGDNLKLWGDTDGDSVLTGNERLFANPGALVLGTIEEIVLTVSSETRSPIGRDRAYRSVTVTTRTNLFNIPTQEPKYSISGHYLIDGGGVIEGGNVYLNTGEVKVTIADGSFQFLVENGNYVVTPELLIHSGSYYYMLLNPQDTLVTVNSNDVTDIDFRYQSISDLDICGISGMVYNDTISPTGLPAIPTAGERGIAGVRVSVIGKSDYSDTTLLSFSTTTNDSGGYNFTLPMGKYTVIETDSVTYYSTTPNTVADTLSATGENDVVNFGDAMGDVCRIKIKVWHDANKDSTEDTGEIGLSNVLCGITKGGFADIEVTSGRTDANGEVTFYVPSDTVYSIFEIDPDTMTSTCAVELGWHNPPLAGDSVIYGFLNRIDNVVVPKDSTFRAKFGDATGFITISLGETERVLSLVTPNLKENNDPPGDKSNPTSSSADLDIVLGTVHATSSNMLVWYNRYKNATTPLSGIFPSNPDTSINMLYDIPALATANFDVSYPNFSTTEDLVVGLSQNPDGYMYNIKVGLTHNGGTSAAAKANKGLVMATVKSYATNPLTAPTSNTDVFSLAAGLLTASNQPDFAVGTKTADNSGTLEIWKNDSTGLSFARVQEIGMADGDYLGEVRAIAVADVVDSTGTAGSDGLADLIIGTKTGSSPYAGQLIIFRRAGRNLGFDFHEKIDIIDAYINTLAVYKSGKTTNSKLDIIYGTRGDASNPAVYIGKIYLWHNNDDGTFGASSGTVANDSVNVGAEVLSLAIGMIDIDNLYDVVVGAKTAENVGFTRIYMGEPGYLPMAGQDPSGGTQTGEVVCVRTAIFRPTPGNTDILVGIREVNLSGDQVGKLVIYFSAF